MNFEQKFILEVKDNENKPYRLECPAGTSWPDLYAVVSKMNAFAYGNLQKHQEAAQKEEGLEKAEEKAEEK